MFQEILNKLKDCLRCVPVIIMTLKVKSMENPQTEPSEDAVAGEFDTNCQYTPDTSKTKVSPGQATKQTETNGYFQNNAYSRENKYDKFENQSSEDSFATYYVNTEVWSSDRLRKDKNIYANRYQDTSKRFRGFWHLMFQWKGSVLKLIYHDLITFLLLYLTINFIYRYYLYETAKECDKNEPCYAEIGRQWFELFCVYCGRFKNLIPITFLTGFYVSEVVKRYWDQFMSLPVPDRLALKLICYVPGKDDFRKNLRLTVMRYVNLSIVLVFRLVSTKVHQRFPTYQSLVEARLILPHEVQRLIHADIRTPHESTWVPVLWALKLLERARTEGKIQIEAPVYASLISAFEYLEINNRKLLNYGWVNFPIAYTQVATISVFSYFFFSLFGAQFLVPQEEVMDNKTFPNITISNNAFFAITDPLKNHTPYIYFPFFTIVEFISYMGWIKVAEALLNPFGDDDEDFQINYLIDRNFQVSRMIVDEADMEMEMATDPFIEAGIEVPANLPYQDSDQQEDSYKKVVGDENEVPSLADKLRKISNWGGRGSGADAISIRTRNNSIISSRSQGVPIRRKRTMSDRSELANQIRVLKNGKKRSVYRRSDTTISLGSTLGDEKSTKKISFQEDIEKMHSDERAPNSNQPNKSNFKEGTIHRISEERPEDMTISSSTTLKDQMMSYNITNVTAPMMRKKAFLVSQLGIDNPTFHDENSSYVLDTLTLTTNRLNSTDCSVKL